MCTSRFTSAAPMCTSSFTKCCCCHVKSQTSAHQGSEVLRVPRNLRFKDHKGSQSAVPSATALRRSQSVVPACTLTKMHSVQPCQCASQQKHVETQVRDAKAFARYFSQNLKTSHMSQILRAIHYPYLQITAHQRPPPMFCV